MSEDQRPSAGSGSEAGGTPPTYRLRRPVRMIVSGFVGAGTVTILNELARRLFSHTPRMDVIGERALARSMEVADLPPPREDQVYRWSIAGDMASNTAYYGLVGLRSPQITCPVAAVLGVVAGLGPAFLPRPLGLGRQPGARQPLTGLLTVAWYTAGGLAAAALCHALEEQGSRRR